MPVLPKILLSLLLGCCGLSALAQEPAGLYHGEAPVAGQDEAGRDQALRMALAEVLVKLTGRADVARQPGVARALTRAPSMASNLQFRQQSETVDGAPVQQVYIAADFDPAAVDDLLAECDLIAWPQPRPTPVLWLAIDDGRGPRLVAAAQGAAVDSLRARAQRRGIRVIVPEGTPEESNFGVQAAWNDDPEAAQALQSRYDSPVQLIGRLFRSDAGWRSQWRLLEHGQELRRWDDSGADARVVLASAADASADVLAGRFIELVSAGPPGVFTVRVEGLADADDYPRLIGYLDRLGTVRRVLPLAADPDGLVLELDLAIGIEGFTRLMAAGPMLKPIPSSDALPAFRLRP